MILAAIDDLMLRSRVSAAAKPSGASVRYPSTGPDVLQAARDERPTLIILDLNGRRADPLGTLAALKGDPALASIPVLGFVAHVDAPAIQAARDAGIDEVLARGAFVDQLPDILRRAAM